MIIWFLLAGANAFFAYVNLKVANPKRFYLGGVNLAAAAMCLAVAFTP